MRVVVLWMRFGPYHLARLRGAAQVGVEQGARVVGVEVASQDHYGWEVVDGAEGFERRTLFPGRSYGELSSAAIREALTRLLDEERPEVLAINGWGTAEARSALAWARKHPKVTAVLMSETQADGRPRSWWKEALKARLIRRCDAALVGGRAQAAYLRGLGFPSDRIFAGYDVVDNEHFRQGAALARQQSGSVRARLRLPERYFFACTRLLPRKNVDGLLRAYAAYRAAASGAAWDLVVAGSGEQAEPLRRLARELGVDGVLWPGFLQHDELPAYFGLAGAFVHPAHTEAWGLVVNEAAASALPLLVARPVGAACELLAEGENGYLFDPSSVMEMSRALTAVSGLPPAARDAMGACSARIIADWPPLRFGEGLFAAVESARAGAMTGSAAR